MDPIALLQKNMDSFTKSEQKLAQYILDNPRCVLGEGISSIAKSADSSNAALVRLCQKLGYKGFSEFKFSMHRYLLSHGAERSGEQGESSSPMQAAIEATTFNTPKCAVYQNVDAQAHTCPDEIKANLIAQLTASVRWKQEVQNMIDAGATDFTECGPGKVLQGLIGKIAKGNDAVTAHGIQA